MHELATRGTLDGYEYELKQMESVYNKARTGIVPVSCFEIHIVNMMAEKSLTFYCTVILELIQNITIEERVAILEGQVMVIEDKVTGLDQDINFLFDEQVIQDERLFSLEQTSLGILEELTVIDDELESGLIFVELSNSALIIIIANNCLIDPYF